MKTSSSPTTPNYLFLNGFGNYYFRIAIPRKLRDSLKKYEIRRTLKTKSYSVAVKKARRLAVMAEALFKKENMTEKELNELLLISTQIKMTGPVKIGNGVLECGGMETDPNNPLDLQALDKVLEFVKTTGVSPERTAIIKLVEKILEADPSSSELIELLGKINNTSGGSLAPQSPKPQTTKIKFDELISKFSSFKHSSKHWSDKTCGENLAIFEYPKKYFGDIPVDEITHDDADMFRGILTKLPSNMNKSPMYRKKTISQIINMKPQKTLDVASVNKYMRRISAMFNWAEERRHVSINPFAKKKIEEDKSPNQKRSILSPTDLAALFSPVNFYSKLDTAYKFFIPLIGLYTGARLNEIASLSSAQICHEHGVWCFRFITSKRKKHIERFVPIHSHLQKLGLLEYAEKQKGQLFPELHAKRDGYGQTVSRWYNRYRRKCGLTATRDGDFHSYRHTLATSISRKGVDSRIISDILGHSHGGPKSTTTDRVYIKPEEVTALAVAIEKLDYGEPVNSLNHFDLLLPSGS